MSILVKNHMSRKLLLLAGGNAAIAVLNRTRPNHYRKPRPFLLGIVAVALLVAVLALTLGGGLNGIETAEAQEGLTITNGVGSLNVSWPPVSGATGYKVEWDCGCILNNSAEGTKGDSGVITETSYRIPWLAEGRSYAVKVSAYGGSVTTLSGIGWTNSEAVGLSVTSADPDFLKLNWYSQTRDATPFHVRWKRADANAWSSPAKVVPANSPRNSLNQVSLGEYTVTDPSLMEGFLYDVQVGWEWRGWDGTGTPQYRWTEAVTAKPVGPSDGCAGSPQLLTFVEGFDNLLQQRLQRAINSGEMWDGECDSSYRTSRYSKYYRFTLTEPQHVAIYLEGSSPTDDTKTTTEDGGGTTTIISNPHKAIPYIVLWAGAGDNSSFDGNPGPLASENHYMRSLQKDYVEDPANPGTFRATRVEQTINKTRAVMYRYLGAGTYTIEATTWLAYDGNTQQGGRFNMAVYHNDWVGTPLEVNSPVPSMSDGGRPDPERPTFISTPPIFLRPAEDQTATALEAFSYTVPEATDFDNDAITYTAALANGDDLPAWLSFDPATRTFSGTPGNADAPAALSIEVTVTDDSDTPDGSYTGFTLTVNPAPQESRDDGNSGEPQQTYQQVAGCFTQLGQLTGEQYWSGEWYWHYQHRIVEGYQHFDPALECNAHHRAERPARYFQFTLDRAEKVAFDLSALEPGAAAALYVSNDTPRNPWGTLPKNGYDNRVSTRLANGKLLHDATTKTTLTLPAGSYTVEAAAASTKSDTFTLSISVVTTMAPEDDNGNEGETQAPANQEPSFAANLDTTLEVAENSAGGVNVGSPITATDPDDGDTLTYSLSGTDAASFAIDSATGQISTKTGVTYDYEGKSSYSLTVGASDGNGGTDSITLTVNLTDVNEAPVFGEGEADETGIMFTTREVAENSPAGTNVGSPIDVTDPDDGDTLSYSLSGTDATSFAIDAATGQITTKTGMTYDYEAKSSYAIVVAVVDSKGKLNAIGVTVSLTDVEETPPVVEKPAPPAPTPPTASAGVDFNGKRGEVVTLSGSGAANAAGSQTLTYRWRISGASHTELASASAFLSSADSAEATFTMPRRKNMTDRSALDDGNWIDFELTVTDGDGEQATDTVRLTIGGTTWTSG